MGCKVSKIHTVSGREIDDSIHAMLAKDARAAARRGEALPSYKPRAQHPMLRLSIIEESSDASMTAASSVAINEAESTVDHEQFLHYAKHHFDIVDRRDFDIVRDNERSQELSR